MGMWFFSFAVFFVTTSGTALDLHEVRISPIYRHRLNDAQRKFDQWCTVGGYPVN